MNTHEKITVKYPDRKGADSTPAKAQRSEIDLPSSPHHGQILHLQQTIGNQAVQRLIKSGVIQAKLKIGQPNDIYEQEADRVADQVMNAEVKGQGSEVRGGNSRIQPKPT